MLILTCFCIYSLLYIYIYINIVHITGLLHKVRLCRVYGKMFFLMESFLNCEEYELSKCSTAKGAINSGIRQNSTSIHLFFSTSIVSLMILSLWADELNMWQSIWLVATSWDSLVVVIWSYKSTLLKNSSIFHHLLFGFEVSRFGT